MVKPLDYSGHQPDESQQSEVRGFGLRADDFRTPQEHDAIVQEAFRQAREQQKPVKQARDRAQYVRQQKGHSWLLHWCVLGIFTLWIVPIYYSFSPNHYWHI